jgi:hypothetical protein
MSLLDIDFGDPGIMLYHLQTAMTKQRFQGKDIAARTQVRDGKRVPETMRMTFFHSNFCPQRVDQLPQGVTVERPVELAEEKRSIWIVTILALSQIPPEEPPCRFPHEYDPAFASLRFPGFARPDLDSAGLHIYICDAQRTEFPGTQTSI